ncbi:MAG: GGDEF domain-containing protein [Rhizobium sp.]
MDLLRRWLSLQIDLGNFNSRGAIAGFALKMTFRAVILASLFSIAVLPLAHYFGLLPMGLGEAIKLSVALSWLLGGAVSGALAIVTGNVIRDLSVSRAKFEHLSRTDMLSGLMNRRAFSDALNATDANASLAILDLDHFKSINDTHGHCAGDAVIRAVSDTIREIFGDQHCVARLGGEEFGVIVRGIGMAHRLVMVEQVRALIAARPTECDGFEIYTTISAGVAEFRPDRRKESIYSAADRALYLAKTEGRNRVVHEECGHRAIAEPDNTRSERAASTMDAA